MKKCFNHLNLVIGGKKKYLFEKLIITMFQYFIVIVSYLLFQVKATNIMIFKISKGCCRHNHYGTGTHGAAKTHQIFDGKNYSRKEGVQSFVSVTTKWVEALLAHCTENWISISV